MKRRHVPRRFDLATLGAGTEGGQCRPPVVGEKPAEEATWRQLERLEHGEEMA